MTRRSCEKRKPFKIITKNLDSDKHLRSMRGQCFLVIHSYMIIGTNKAIINSYITMFFHHRMTIGVSSTASWGWSRGDGYGIRLKDNPRWLIYIKARI